MSLEEPTRENLEFIINDMADRLQVVNRTIMDPDDYDLEKYDEIKELHDIVQMKGQLSVSEIQTFVQELGRFRKPQ
ncbi:DUF1128 domain-containing protein [Halobacillus halophilus]|uniref:Uncharacterized protein n=1 Tax=Halobacillus halophilus (strain ATCC 35676 / DSM 2266 / JCM 20832 / KCTC 3685 / LMG 17431 / NBRC 102448 / NCIMB 2269) TaxID=866895 RepID=I0JMI2_HALH3|nr:DUF1128 domain-containing protein [Halobacillus halophilus]ASF39434.1 hypothetical protein CEH05_09970 [Halobacillus halophilus]MCA1009204.1 DUF1128 domain-containing protein [Halobacillus halophilus]CCG45352.1 hypothetical protein HBHAL_3005 [Halobacillus halophilus DSM 2266]